MTANQKEAHFVIRRQYGENEANWPHGLKKVVKMKGNKRELALCSLAFSIKYLQTLMLDDSVLPFARFAPHMSFDSYSGHMNLPGTTLDQLDIFEVQATGLKKGSLYDYLDRCKTPGGSRLLKKWL